MDFEDNPQEAEFRQQARSWLAEEAPAHCVEVESAEENWEAARNWQRAKFDAGWACISWPKEWGGRGGSRMESIIFDQEESRYPVPKANLGIGLGTCAAALMAHASEEQKRRYLPKLARADEVWCQLFSEPGAGSDLAGLRTRAERDGDEWVVNGQKVWNTGVQYADYAILVARHDPTLVKHKGLTFFIADIKKPGIEFRPIRQIPGGSEFNEVFLQNFRVPDENRIGEVGEGWQVAITTLMNERFGVAGRKPDVRDALALAARVEVDGQKAIELRDVRERIADWFVASEGVRLTHFRALTALSQGRQPGPEGSISKVVGAPMRQEIASFGLDLLESSGPGLDDSRDRLFFDGYLNAPGARIAAGTDEVLRNIIAERVLGLPGDVRVDRDKAFRDVPSGSR